jgi:hypothetical protein
MKTTFMMTALALLLASTCRASDSLDLGLVLRYSFDGDFLDSSGNSRHPSTHNVILTNDRHGRVASACLFDGTSSYLSRASVPEPTDNAFTWAAWIRLDSLNGSSPEGPYLVSRCLELGQNPLSPRFVLLFSGAARLNGCCYDGFGIDGSLTTAPGILRTGEWAHVAVTSQRIDGGTGGTRKIFVNGQETATDSVPFYGQTGHGVVQIGADRFLRPEAFFHGAMDDLRIYQRQLSVNEIRQLAIRAAVQWSTSDGGNGHWYELVRGATSIGWEAARQAAAARGGHLATISSAAESALLFSLTGGYSSWPNAYGPWLGGFRQGNAWRWVTDEPWAWSDWCPGEPNNDSCSNLPENALQLGCGSGRWNDFPGDPTGCDFDQNGLAVWGYFVEWSADCNNDGIVDYGQILDGTFTDANSNGIPDSCDCLGDIDDDGWIDGVDLGGVLAAWGKAPAGTPADLNADGAVDGTDLGVLLAGWGACAP